MSLSTQPYSGARDFYPEDKLIHNFIFNNIRKVIEKYGYEEYDGSILEPVELFLAKSSADLVNDQSYHFRDRGGRLVVMRPEVTPSVSRLVASRRYDLGFPLRWYSIADIWRYEDPNGEGLNQRWQLNVDNFGITNLAAEQELIQIAVNILKRFGAKQRMYTIKLNSRRLAEYLFKDYLGLDLTQTGSLVKLIDRVKELDFTTFAANVDVLVTPSQREAGLDSKILDLLRTTSLDTLPEAVKDCPYITEIKTLINMLEESKITNVVYDITLIRDFDYYSDMVFEIHDNEPKNKQAIFGGGRYDDLVGLFGVDDLPAAGFGMSDIDLQRFLSLHDLLPSLTTNTDLYVVTVGDVYNKALLVANELRDMGVAVALDTTLDVLEKQIENATKKKIKYILIVEDTESEDEHYKLKNLTTGEEESHGLARIVSIVKDYRQGL